MTHVLCIRENYYVFSVGLLKKCETPLKKSMMFQLRWKGKGWTDLSDKCKYQVKNEYVYIYNIQGLFSNIKTLEKYTKTDVDFQDRSSKKKIVEKMNKRPKKKTRNHQQNYMKNYLKHRH